MKKRRSIQSLTAALLAAIICAAMAECDGRENRSRITDKEIEDALKGLDQYGQGSADPTSEPVPEELDPFENLKVTFEGVSPKSRVSFRGGSSYVNYTANVERGMKNGDTVTVAAEPTRYTDRYVLTQTEKEFPVEGLPAYIETLDELSEDDLDKLDPKIRDAYDGEILTYGAESKLNSMEFLGNYMLFQKDVDSFSGSINSLYFVYKISAYFSRTEETADYYFCACYKYLQRLSERTAAMHKRDSLNS